MANTLTNGATTVTLNDDLLWLDEFDWSAAQVQSSFSVAGALLRDSGVRLAGRPITLRGDQSFGWTARSDVLTLYGWAQTADPTLTLSYRGVSYSVGFNYDAGRVVEAAPIIDYNTVTSGDNYSLVLRLITKA